MAVSGSPTEAISIRQRVAKLRRLLMIVTSLPTGIRLLSGRLMVRQDTLARFFSSLANGTRKYHEARSSRNLQLCATKFGLERSYAVGWCS